LELILDKTDVLEYVEGKVIVPVENAPLAAKSKYKKGELKDKKILIDGLQDHLLVYVGSLKKSNESMIRWLGCMR